MLSRDPYIVGQHANHLGCVVEWLIFSCFFRATHVWNWTAEEKVSQHRCGSEVLSFVKVAKHVAYAYRYYCTAVSDVIATVIEHTEANMSNCTTCPIQSCEASLFGFPIFRIACPEKSGIVVVHRNMDSRTRSLSVVLNLYVNNLTVLFVFTAKFFLASFILLNPSQSISHCHRGLLTIQFFFCSPCLLTFCGFPS